MAIYEIIKSIFFNGLLLVNPFSQNMCTKPRDSGWSIFSIDHPQGFVHGF
ncbi:hypothetical protein SAMN05660903_00867 [Salegentibacter salinarum]|nr:hypothetical protein SAMN05660903_00867 [Salegentibacter salinarum]